MTPERMSALVARWVRFYTRELAAPIAERRAGEVAADLHDHIAHERAAGISDRRIALGIGSRMLRGLAADATWRGRNLDRKDTMTRRSIVRVALVTGLILLLPLVTTLTGDGEGWSVADFVLGAVLLGGTGLLLELAVSKPRNVAYQVVAGAIGAAAIVLGEGDDAPGLVLFGCLLIAGTIALAVRTALRSQ